MLAGCSSLPTPAGWKSQSTVQAEEMNALVRDVIQYDIDNPVERIDPCASIAKPNKYMPAEATSMYYLSMVSCQALAGTVPVPESTSAIALREIASLEKAKIKSKGEMTKVVANTLMGVARLGVDLDIASKDRESRERIADTERSGDSIPTISVGGDYITGEGNANSTTTTDSNDNTETTTTTADSHDTTTTDSNDNTETTTTTTTDSNDNTETTTTTDSHDNTETTTDHSVTNNNYAAPAEEGEDPVIEDLHARCHYDAETDDDRIRCNINYQKAQLLEALRKCDDNGWARDGDECGDELEDRHTWAKRMGLIYDPARMTYVLPTDEEEEEEEGGSPPVAQ